MQLLSKNNRLIISLLHLLLFGFVTSSLAFKSSEDEPICNYRMLELELAKKLAHVLKQHAECDDIAKVTWQAKSKPVITYSGSRSSALLKEEDLIGDDVDFKLDYDNDKHHHNQQQKQQQGGGSSRSGSKSSNSNGSCKEKTLIAGIEKAMQKELKSAAKKYKCFTDDLPVICKLDRDDPWVKGPWVTCAISLPSTDFTAAVTGATAVEGSVKEFNSARVADNQQSPLPLGVKQDVAEAGVVTDSRGQQQQQQQRQELCVEEKLRVSVSKIVGKIVMKANRKCDIQALSCSRGPDDQSWTLKHCSIFQGPGSSSGGSGGGSSEGAGGSGGGADGQPPPQLPKELQELKVIEEQQQKQKSTLTLTGGEGSGNWGSMVNANKGGGGGGDSKCDLEKVRRHISQKVGPLLNQAEVAYGCRSLDTLYCQTTLLGDDVTCFLDSQQPNSAWVSNSKSNSNGNSNNSKSNGDAGIASGMTPQAAPIGGGRGGKGEGGGAAAAAGGGSGRSQSKPLTSPSTSFKKPGSVRSNANSSSTFPATSAINAGTPGSSSGSGAGSIPAGFSSTGGVKPSVKGSSWTKDSAAGNGSGGGGSGGGKAVPKKVVIPELNSDHMGGGGGSLFDDSSDDANSFLVL